MSRKDLKDIVASIHQKLLNKSREEGRPFEELQQYYAMERFLYRLSMSEHRSKFILKGALSLVAARAPATRPTRDIDLKGEMSNDVDDVVAVIADICGTEVEPDGMDFHADTVQGDVIDDDDDYNGVRVVFKGSLGNARVKMQLDIGFGDNVVPSPRSVKYPVILDHPEFELLTYPFESTIAEKFQAMVRHGEVNSRMKDFFDVWYLLRNFDFDDRVLKKAIETTFQTRSTEVPEDIHEFFGRLKSPEKERQWTAFVVRSKLSVSPETFAAAIDTLADQLTHVMR